MPTEQDLAQLPPPPAGTYWATPAERGQAVLLYQRNLAKKVNDNKDAIKSTWLKLDPNARKEVTLRGSVAGEDSFLLTKDDSRLGDLHLKIPEFNLHDLSTDPHHLFRLLESRSKNTPIEAFMSDHSFILSQTRRGLTSSTGKKYGSIMLWADEDNFGEVYYARDAKMPYDDALEHVNMMLRNRWAVTDHDGDLVLERQSHLYLGLGILVDDILDKKQEMEEEAEGKKVSAGKKRRPLRAGGTDDWRATVSEEIISAKNVAWIQAMAIAQARKVTTETHLELMYTEPSYLAWIAGDYFASLAERVPDEKGKIVQMNDTSSSTLASVALIECINMAWKQWAYAEAISKMLTQLDQNPSEVENLRDELWIVASLELRRNLALLRRFLQIESSYAKYFVRVPGSGSAGEENTIKVTGTVAAIEKKNVFAGWLIRLVTSEPAQPVPDYQEVKKTLQKMKDFQENTPPGGIKLSERVADVLNDLTVAVELLFCIKGVILKPAQQTDSDFSKRVKELRERIDQAKRRCDLQNNAFPIAKLKENMDTCLEKVHEHFVKEFNGYDLAELYTNLSRFCWDGLDGVVPEASQANESRSKLKELWVYRNTVTPAAASTIIVDRKSHQILKKLFETRPPKGNTSGSPPSGITWNELATAMLTGLKCEIVSVAQAGGDTRVYLFKPQKQKLWRRVVFQKPYYRSGGRFGEFGMIRIARTLEKRFGLKMEQLVVKG